MSGLTYTRMLSVDDIDIPRFISIYQKTEISQYLSIGDNYFHYVTNTTNVFFYKVYSNKNLIGSIHLEKQKKLLYMDILVFPEFQRNGLGMRIINDIQNDIFEFDYERIEISIDERNSASLRLFEKAGFTFVSKDEELMNFLYQRRKE
jgi:RimJ/RimL family protein N-acetyltransferase